MKPGRRYGDKEVGAILRRAAELQSVETEGSIQAAEFDLGLEDLERIAAEAGIDAQHVRAAASELQSGALDQKKFHWAGAPGMVHLERTVDGEITTEAWEDAISHLRLTFGDAGQGGQTGSSVEWKSSVGDLMSLTVSMTPRRGRTRIQVLRDYSGALGLTLIVGTAFSVLSAAGIGSALTKAVGNPVATILAVLATIGLGITLMRGYLGNLAKRDSKKLNGVMETLTGLVERESTSGTAIQEPIEELQQTTS